MGNVWSWPSRTFSYDQTRLARFHRALRAARDRDRAKWASIACSAAGYYDEAHLVAECRSVAGAAPRAFLDELDAVLSVG